jgi:hypothetical protein
MSELTSDLAGVPLQYQVYITWALLGIKYLAELYSSVRAGGGMRRIIMSFWFGENIPKKIADDYKPELSTHETKP